MQQMLSTGAWLFSLFYAYLAARSVWWVYSPENQQYRDGTPFMAFFAFFMLPLAFPVGILLFRDLRRLTTTSSQLTARLRLALRTRAMIGSISLAAIFWLLILGFLLY